jgi:hypothetical protein
MCHVPVSVTGSVGELEHDNAPPIAVNAIARVKPLPRRFSHIRGYFANEYSWLMVPPSDGGVGYQMCKWSVFPAIAPNGREASPYM